MLGWTLAAYDTGEGHVIPRDDLQEHTHPGLSCPCGPTPDPEQPLCVVHHSWDRREEFEQAVRKVS